MSGSAAGAASRTVGSASISFRTRTSCPWVTDDRFSSDRHVDEELLLQSWCVVVDRCDAIERSNFRNHSADRRRDHPAGGGVAVSRLVALGLVEHRVEDEARLVHRECADEGGDARIALVATVDDLLRGTGLATDE